MDWLDSKSRNSLHRIIRVRPLSILLRKEIMISVLRWDKVVLNNREMRILWYRLKVRRYSHRILLAKASRYKDRAQGWEWRLCFLRLWWAKGRTRRLRAWARIPLAIMLLFQDRYSNNWATGSHLEESVQVLVRWLLAVILGYHQTACLNSWARIQEHEIVWLTSSTTLLMEQQVLKE